MIYSFLDQIMVKKKIILFIFVGELHFCGMKISSNLFYENKQKKKKERKKERKKTNYRLFIC